MAIYLIYGLILKIRTNTKYNITKRALFNKIGTPYFILGGFRKKTIL